MISATPLLSKLIILVDLILAAYRAAETRLRASQASVVPQTWSVVQEKLILCASLAYVAASVCLVSLAPCKDRLGWGVLKR